MGDANDLAFRIDYWLEHPAEREIRGKEYAQFAKKFDSEKCMDHMEKMFYAASQQKQDHILLGFDGRFCGDEYQDEGSGCEIPVRS
jgi:hypothetical protein